MKMKRVSLFLAGVLLASLSSASVSFTTDSAVAAIDNVSPAPGVTLTPVASGLDYVLNATGFVLDGQNYDYGDIAWAYHFASTENLVSVNYKINGIIYSNDGTDASAYITGDEKIRDLDSSSTYALELGDNYFHTSSMEGEAFTVSGTTALGSGILNGQVSKDNLFLTLSDNVRVKITSIEQNYATPEPASLAALAIGGAALLRRRKKA